MAHKRNTSGLKPWKPGQSGNPSGRPKTKPITDEYFRLADQPIPEKLRKKLAKKWDVAIRDGATYSEVNAIMRYLNAFEPGGHTSSKEIRESIEGKAPERIEISGPERKEITIRVLRDRLKR